MTHELQVAIVDHLAPTGRTAIVNLPTTEDELTAVLNEADIPGTDCCKITQCTVPVDYLQDALNDAIVYEDDADVLTRLNFLAGRLSRMSDYERSLFEGAVKMRTESPSTTDLINDTYNLDQSYILAGIETLSELGNYYLKNGDPPIPKELAEYIDTASLGKRTDSIMGGAFVDGGYAISALHEDDYIELYDTDDMPDICEESHPVYFRMTISLASEYSRYGDSAPTFVLKVPETGYSDSIEKFVFHKFKASSFDEFVVVQCECYEPLLSSLPATGTLSEVYSLSFDLYDAYMHGGQDPDRIFAAIEAVGWDKPTLSDVRNIYNSNINNLNYHMNIKTPEQYAEWYIDKRYQSCDKQMLASTIDMRRYGSDLLASTNAYLTSYGLIIDPNNELKYIQTESADISEGVGGQSM